MPKDPILPLYYTDLLSSTSSWTDEEFGAYVRLLIEQWDKGGIPDDATRLKRIASTAKKHWKLIGQKFVKSDKGLQNTKMEEVRESRKKFKEKQRENVRNRYQNSTKLPTKAATKTLPLEDEIEIENRKGGAGGKELGSVAVVEIANQVWTDKGWRDQICMGLTLQPEQLQKWMAQFNSSIANDPIPDFSPGKYKKMIRGWISKQQSNGYSLPDSNRKSTAPPLKIVSHDS